MADILTCPFCHLRFGGNRDEFVDHLKREHPDRYRPPNQPDETSEAPDRSADRRR